MRLLFIFIAMTSSSLTLANPPHLMTVKSRLRILLWTEGLKEPMLAKQQAAQPKRLPEELEKPLQKF